VIRQRAAMPPQTHLCTVHILYKGPARTPTPRKKCTFLMEISTHIEDKVPWTHKSTSPTRHFDRFIRFHSAHVCRKHAHIYHATCHICRKGPHLYALRQGWATLLSTFFDWQWTTTARLFAIFAGHAVHAPEETS